MVDLTHLLCQQVFTCNVLTLAMTTGDDVRMARPPRTGGLSEIGELLHVTRQRVNTLAKRKDFPAPVATSRAGRIWDLAEIEAWACTWDRENRGGRPKLEQPPAAED